jgi:hypothetical protein
MPASYSPIEPRRIDVSEQEAERQCVWQRELDELSALIEVDKCAEMHTRWLGSLF